MERHDVNTLSLPLNIRRGGSDTNLNFDVADGIFEFHKVKLSADSLKQKILKVTEQIKIEQTARDGNVAEYLKLVNSADKQQAGRIKQVFEKKNQKSAHSIAQLQKKLEQYHRKLKEIEQNSSSKSTRDTSKDSLKEIQHSLKDAHGKARATSQANESCKTGVPGVSLTPPVFVFNKSREFANLIRNKFGSADNIAHLKSSLDDFRPETTSRAYGGSATIVAKPKYTSDDECSSGTSGSIDSNGNQSFGQGGANTLDNHGKLSIFLEELREIKEAQSQLSEDIQNLKVQFKRDHGFISQTLQEERFRYTIICCYITIVHCCSIGGWLPLCFWFQFKISVMIYEVLHVMGPGYLKDCLPCLHLPIPLELVGEICFRSHLLENVIWQDPGREPLLSWSSLTLWHIIPLGDHIASTPLAFCQA